MKFHFHGMRHLLAWLKSHPQGQTVAEKYLKWWLETDDGQRCLENKITDAAVVHVLAVVHHDRIELFAPSRVRVHDIVAVHGNSPQAEALSEELVELELPLGLKSIYFPINRVAVLSQEKRTVYEVLGRQVALTADVGAMRTLKELRNVIVDELSALRHERESDDSGRLAETVCE